MFNTVKYAWILLITIGCYSYEHKCKLFKNGTFTFVYFDENGKHETIFTRHNDIEVSRYNSKIDTAYVRWISPCEYILKTKHPNNYIESRPIQVKITHTFNDGYHFEYFLVNELTNIKRGTAYILKKDD